MMEGNNGQLSVPPGFRFHPTDEELLYYYLRKKVSYEPIDLDVIREVDLNKLEPWDLKDKCRIGSGPQSDWYFFSHKDKKYPTGTRTNRATTAGFWKATGRDKAIYLPNSKRIGMRKTLVFYTGRAPHGQKTDWIMHEYRLDDDNNVDIQEDGWVVCRVFKKKNLCKVFQPETNHSEEEQQQQHLSTHHNHNHHHHHHLQMDPQLLHGVDYTNTFDGSMHLPQLLSPDSNPHQPSFLTPMAAMAAMDNNNIGCSQSFLRLTTGGGGGGGGGGCSAGSHHGISQRQEKFIGDWSFLDKLLTNSQQGLDQSKVYPAALSLSAAAAAADGVSSSTHQRFPFNYLGFESDVFKFSK